MALLHLTSRHRPSRRAIALILIKEGQTDAARFAGKMLV